MKKRIYTVIEVKERELLGKSLFAVKMAEAGFSIVIGKKSRLFKYANYFRTGVYYFKGMGDNNIIPMKHVKKAGHKVVGFDEEGLVMNMTQAIPKRVRKECMEMVDYFFTVGQKQSINTKIVYPNFKNKIFEIGNPRWDILKKEIRDFYTEESEKLKKKYGRFIFFPTKFTILNNTWIKGIPKDTPKGIGRTVLEEDFDDQKKIEKKLLKFFNEIPKKYPKIKFVIKPHPVEDSYYWKKIIKKINSKNIILGDRNYSTNAYILASEFNIGSNCHTSLESYLCNKPTINLRASKKESLVISDVIRAVSTKEVLEIKELDALINRWIVQKKIFVKNLSKKNKQILNFNIKNIKKYSSFFIQKKIELIDLNYKNKHDKFSNKFFFRIFEIINKIINYFNRFRLSSSEEKYWKQKFPGLDIMEVSENIKKICSLLNLNKSKFKIKEIYPGCFCVEKE